MKAEAKHLEAMAMSRLQVSRVRNLMRAVTMLAAALAVFAATSSAAQAALGFEEFDVRFENEDGSVDTQAGSHPYAMRTKLFLNFHEDPVLGEVPDEELRDLTLRLPVGFAGRPSAVPTCSTADFLRPDPVGLSSCPKSSVVGKVNASIVHPGGGAKSEVFNLTPPPGVPAKLGFIVAREPLTIEVGVNNSPPYNVSSVTEMAPQPVPFFGLDLTIWGVPAAHRPDTQPSGCLEGTAPCPIPDGAEPFLTLPRSCSGPLLSNYFADSWQHPGTRLLDGDPDFSDSAWIKGEFITQDDSEPPIPLGLSGCGKLPFKPTITAKPTTRAASSPTGLDFSLDVNDEGLTNPSAEAVANSDIKEAVVTLPEGFSTNPSIAEGLNVCSEAELARETVTSMPGAGCPEASKIGTVEVETPLLDESVDGSLFLAKPYENPFNSLLALYIVVKNPTLGIIVKQPLEVQNDPRTGQITTVAREIPQLPFSHFKLHFREGARSPLASPPICGTFNATARLTPWAGGAPVTTSSAFQIISGPESQPCPGGGLPPFHPGLIAGSINNAAGRFSPFNVRLFRNDSEQEITHFSIKLPPGITAKLAGVPYCSDAAIAQAIARTGPHGGQEELNNPSCPAASEIGHTLVGGGVGSALAYAPGKIYLAGPYHGSNLSIVAITSGIVGPFDIGTVVVREALRIDPETAEAFIDATGSDPIPHIIKGIPVHLRDIRAYVDKPNFTLNPTDCSRTSTASTVLGSGLDFGSEADDRPVTVSTPYQAADCAALPFKPKLGLKLKGGTRRGANPAFIARLAMNGIGEAGIARAEVTLPKSEFLQQSHIETICTRVQFKAGAGNGAGCPARSIYGKARAVTPILGEALTGPVFLRSSEHELPDLVVALHNSQVDFDLIGHIDSLNGRIRNTFEAAPDAPVTSFILEMQGGKKSLLVNSTNLCKGTHRAESNFTGQNGKRYDTRPLLQAECGAKAKKKHKRAGAKHRRTH